MNKITEIKKFFSYKISGQEIFLLAFVLYFFLSFISTSTFMQYLPSKIINLSSYISVGLIIIKIYLLDNFEWKQLTLVTLGLIVAAVSWQQSKSTLILLMMVFILGAKDVNFDSIMKIYLGMGILLLGFITIFSILDIIPNLMYTTDIRDTRFALGILYPTDYAAHVLFLILAHSYVFFKRINWKTYLSYFLIALILYKVTDARLDVYSILLVIPMLIIAKIADKKDGIARRLMSLYWISVPILSFIALYATRFFDINNSIFQKVDGLLSGRLTFGYLAFNKYGISLFGNKVVEHGLGQAKGMNSFKDNLYNYLFIDSSYVRLFIIYGVIIAVIVLGIMIFVSIKSWINKQYVLTGILLIVAISCLIEQHILEIAFNPFLLAMMANIKYSGDKTDAKKV